MGEMLWSAIRRGGLMEERWWAGWLHGVQHALDLEDRALWVTMRPPKESGRAWPRRWQADPVTRLLIINWHRDEQVLDLQATPRECLAAFRRGRTDAADVVVTEARQLWAARLPGVLVAYATGRVASTSLPRARWRSLLNLRSLPGAEFARPDAPPRRADGGPHEWAEAIGMSAEWRALNAEIQFETGAKRARRMKDKARTTIEALPPTTSPRRAALRAWCVDALLYQRGQATRRGYATSTVKTYLGHLARAFSDWDRGNPLTAAPGVLRDWIVEHIESLAGEPRDRAIKALLSFERFYNRVHFGTPLRVDVDRYGDQISVSPDVVLPREFAAAVDAVSREQDGEELALILILAFRIGLRLPEIMGLRVGDFTDAGTRLELIVESNHGRTLKTPTSRRVLPLDVLLGPVERTRLVNWLLFSRKVSDAVGEVWMFGPINLRRPADKRVEGRIEAALRKATGVASMRFEHLRHSFASYLLATLLLPQDVATPDVPHALGEVVSPARRELVADRLLGQQRLGGGAVHAVSQALGHTGPDTTATYYCHLLDLVLGLYVERTSTFPPVDMEWLRSELRVGVDAGRKAATRNRAVVTPTDPAGTGYVRPTPSSVEDATPQIADKIGAVALLDSHCRRATRRLRWAIDLREEVASIAGALNGAGHAPGVPDRKSSAAAKASAFVEGPPWQVMVEALDAPTIADEDTVGARLIQRWRRDAEQLRALQVLRGRGSIVGGSFKALVPPDRASRLFIDDRLYAARVDRKPERKALLAAVRSLGQRGCIRLTRLSDARAFVRLLFAMGFKWTEIALSGTSKYANGLSSRELHDLVSNKPLPAGHRARRVSGRACWRGSMEVRLEPAEFGRVRAARACRFVLVMLAIDANLLC